VERWRATENGMEYDLMFEGNSLSTGLFPDSRGMRWWFRCRRWKRGTR